MKKRKKKVTVLYRGLTGRQTKLAKQYRKFFNKFRNAGIEIIGDKEHPDGRTQVAVRYLDGREVLLPQVLSWVALFDKLNEMHPRTPKPVKDRDLS